MKKIRKYYLLCSYSFVMTACSMSEKSDIG